MKESEISGKKTVTFAAILCICFLLVTMGGSLSDSFKDITKEIKGYFNLELGLKGQEGIFKPEPNSLTFPSIPAYTPKKNEPAPLLRTPLEPGFYLSSTYKASQFYQGGLTYIKIDIKNEGRNPIFIDRYGVSVNASKNHVYSKDSGVLILPNEEKNLGVISVQIPEEKRADFKILLWLLASTSEGKWHEYKPYFLNGFSSDLKPMPGQINPKYRYNPSYYFKTVNTLVKPAEPEVRRKAA